MYIGIWLCEARRNLSAVQTNRSLNEFIPHCSFIQSYITPYILT